MRPHRLKHRSPSRSLLDRRQFARLGAATLASLTAPRRARAETAAEFYRGKTVRILVGSPPGGGYDIYARLVTPALAAKLGATVLVENKDGNGGLAALATLLVRPADGLTIMNGSAEAAIISQMLARPGAIWDATKLNWLAKMASAPKLWFVGKDARYQSIAAALQADPLTWSATGPADDISDVQATISYVLGLKSKMGMSRCLLNIEKRSLPSFMLRGVGLASKNGM
jgi:tripartite-type tricarboxylate transporter receptor subunit TctC